MKTDLTPRTGDPYVRLSWRLWEGPFFSGSGDDVAATYTYVWYDRDGNLRERTVENQLLREPVPPCEGLTTEDRDSWMSAIPTPDPPIDYRELLAKYIRHVSDCEGEAYIKHHLNVPQSSVRFTHTESEALRQLEALDHDAHTASGREDGEDGDD